MAHKCFLDDGEYDFVEMCPECGEEVAVLIDHNDHTFYDYCPKCGHRLLFCSMCPTHDGVGTCDWNEITDCYMYRCGHKWEES